MSNLSFFKTYETFPVEIVRAQAREHLTHARARCASTDRRAREMREQRQARARVARARRASTARARSLRTRARAQISSPKVDLVSLFAIWWAYLRFGELICARGELICARACRFARAHLGLACAPRARAPLFARASRARACRCSRTSRAHVLNARALALRTPQLVRHHIWIHMFWIKPMSNYSLVEKQL